MIQSNVYESLELNEQFKSGLNQMEATIAAIPNVVVKVGTLASLLQ